MQRAIGADDWFLWRCCLGWFRVWGSRWECFRVSGTVIYWRERERERERERGRDIGREGEEERGRERGKERERGRKRERKREGGREKEGEKGEREVRKEECDIWTVLSWVNNICENIKIVSMVFEQTRRNCFSRRRWKSMVDLRRMSSALESTVVARHNFVKNPSPSAPSVVVRVCFSSASTSRFPLFEVFLVSQWTNLITRSPIIALPRQTSVFLLRKWCGDGGT